MLENTNLLKPSLLALSVSVALGTLSLSGGAYAQDDADFEIEEVVVTGSRIVRRDYNSNSPIITVDSGDFESQTGLNIESYLNQLPTYNPASSPVTTQGDVQITPINSVGIASISLRGFGANRSLVLVNGKRPVPINPLMVTDVNSIPSALIQRVETITGGASAVYGADAIGGVTNFILRDNFEGFEFDTQFGTTEAGDGDEYRISGVLGANFSDGRGNVTIGFEKYSREESLQSNRDIYTDRWSDPGVAGDGFFLQGVNGYSCNFDCPSLETVAALFGGESPFNPNNPSPHFRGYNFNDDGSIFVTGSATGLSKYTGPLNGYDYASVLAIDTAADPTGQTTYDSLKFNNTQAYAQAPQERHSFFASGNFDITDTVSFFARATFAESVTETLLFGTNAVGGWEGAIPYDPSVDSPVDTTGLDLTDPTVVADIVANPADYANPGFIPTGAEGAHFPVPVEMAILLNDRQSLFGGPSSPTATWQPNWNPLSGLPPRSTYNTNEVWQLEAGLNFELPFSDWTGEAYVSHGESSTYNVAAGNLSLSRYRTLIAQPDYGRGASGLGNQPYLVEGELVNPVRPGFGAGAYTCTSGFYDTFFGGDQPLSDDCFDAVNASLQARTQNQQDIIELNFQGLLMELPAGEARGAFGYQKRDNGAQFSPDILQSRDSFTDQVIGVYPTGYLDASTSVDDFYVEALIPVVSDVPGIQYLELELGARYSDYEATGEDEVTWKALASWQVNDWARLRGGFNRATRSPNIGELFLNPQEVFAGGGAFGDACGTRSISPFGAGGNSFSTDPAVDPNEAPIALAPGQTQAGADSAYLICQALMGDAGATQFYEVADSVAGTGGGFAWVLQEGNSDLKSEIADTWTFGGVFNSQFDSPWLSSLTASFDWYQVEVEDAIMLYSLTYASYRCFGDVLVTTPEEAAAQAASLGCQLSPRDPVSGDALNSTLSYDNSATIKTSGVDVDLNWGSDFSDLGFDIPGGLGINLKATILDTYETKESPAAYDVTTEWKGSLGPNLSGTNGGAYDYRLFGTISYMLDDWSVSLRWRHLPEVHSEAYATQQSIIDNNNRVAAGGEGILLGYTPSTEVAADSYNIFDLSANWNINETLVLRGGISNLFDVEPETIDTRGRAAGSDLDICNDAPGCTNPGSYSLPSVGAFNGGYYDTIGRSMFIGLKATF